MSPIISIWRQPSNTIRYVVENKSLVYALLLVSISSLASSVMAFADSGFLERFSLSMTIILVLMLGLLSGLLGWGITTVAYTWLGKLLGGTGTMRKMGLAVSVGVIPMIWTAPIGIFAILVYGKQLFATPPGLFAITNMSSGFYFFHMLVMLGISIFGIIVQSKGVGIVQNFSAWRGFGTIMLFAGIIFVITFIIVFSFISVFVF